MDRRRHPGKKRIPYLHARLVDGLLGEAVAVTGNRAGLLRLREQLDLALADRGDYPFEEAVYRDALGEPFEVAVRLASRRSELEERAGLPRPAKSAEEMPWAERSGEA